VSLERRPELVDLPAVRKARRAALDDERRDAAGALVGRRRREDDVDLRDRPLRDEHLRAVDHPVVAVTDGARPERSGVAARSPAPSGTTAPSHSPVASFGKVALPDRIAREEIDVPGREPPWLATGESEARRRSA
jgi:hypothetical protein